MLGALLIAGLLWMRDGQPTPQALQLVAVFAQAERRGLEPRDYEVSLQGTPEQVDCALSEAAARFVRHVAVGRVDPRKLGVDLRVEPPAVDLEQLANASDVDAAIEAYEPQLAVYKRTLRALQSRLGDPEQAHKLALTLERLRWAPRGITAPIVVNVPEFRLRAGPLSMRVVVGRAYQWRTPLFASTVDAVIIRPPWYPTLRIQREMLGLEDLSAYEVIDAHGARAELDAAKLQSGELRLRQPPGPQNALGLVKLDVASRYGVYLHGTPAAAAFNRPRRDLSHGCIRVEDPEGLAAWVLGDTREHVHELTQGDSTLRLKAPRAVPLLVVYATAVVSEDGEVSFFKDIYKLDRALEEALLR